jgi:hypothetical protein
MPSVLFALTLMTGCSTAMTNHLSKLGEGDVVRNTFPLKFKSHAFGAYCFNTVGCKVLYANMYHVRKNENEISPPPLPDYLNRVSASTIGIDNFPPAAVVTWHSLDGKPHEAKVDIGAIFKDQRILHHVPEDQIPTETAAFDGASIILVVDDRTINVYMKTTIYLKKPRDPSNPRSTRVHEMTLAYTRTY